MKQQTSNFIFILLAASIFTGACGVKGKPLPPLKSAPLSDPLNRKHTDEKKH